MPSLTLTEEEIHELCAILKSYLTDLRMEIAGTDNADFREGLKWREMLLNKILAQIEGV